MADRRGLAVLVRASARQERRIGARGKTSAKKGPLAGASGPSLGRKRPRRAAGTRQQSRYRAAAICHRAAQKASPDSACPFEGAPPWRNEHSPTLEAAPRPHRGCRSYAASLVPEGPGKHSMTAVDFGSFVEELAAKSGEVILPFFRTSLSIDNKGTVGRFDPVTAADRAAGAAMRALIHKAFPEHGIIGEEYGSEHPDAEYVWVLDPIDGTKSFICGMPAWGTLIGLTRFGKPVFGTMHQPFLGESFTGDGEAARYRGPAGDRELCVRPCAALDEAVLFTTSPLLMSEQDRDAFRRVEQRVRLSRYGGDCYAYCMLAAGHIDLVIETELKPHDIVPLVPIITGAGGVPTAWDGGPAASGSRGALRRSPDASPRAAGSRISR